jgi:hypothetical protein
MNSCVIAGGFKRMAPDAAADSRPPWLARERA